jgi:hypothetical protein
MRNQILTLLFVAAFTIISCNTQPTDPDIEDEIGQHYLDMSKAAGGGSWHAKEINILKKLPSKNGKGVWLITSETKGIYESPPLGNPVPDESFCDTLVFKFRKNEFDVWVGEVVH